MAINKNNYISVAKAIGIMLMVVGHSGSPEIITKMLYTFHMPLFFFCSGFFFKDILSYASLKQFVSKRVRGLYIPYLKWSIGFLLLHNLFCFLQIYNDTVNIRTYTYAGFLQHLLSTFLMTDYELLIRPFWFIKVLLFASIFYALLSWMCSALRTKLNDTYILILIFGLSAFFTKLFNVHFPIIGNLSTIFLAATYFGTGKLFRLFEYRIPHNKIYLILMFLLVLMGSMIYEGTMDMRYTTTGNILFYYILSIIGITMTLGVSQKISHQYAKPLYYIGNHTMPILALNLLALKVGNLAKIAIYDMPIHKLASYTIIYEHNDIFWILYTIIGISIPLLLDASYQYLKKRKKTY